MKKKVLVPIEQLTDEEIEGIAVGLEAKGNAGDLAHARELRQFREMRRTGTLPAATVNYLLSKGKKP